MRLKKLMEIWTDIGANPFHKPWEALLAAVSTVPKVYVVFDALDELAVEVDNFLRCLLELGQNKPNSIKLLMTSRPVSRLQTVL